MVPDIHSLLASVIVVMLSERAMNLRIKLSDQGRQCSTPEVWIGLTTSWSRQVRLLAQSPAKQYGFVEASMLELDVRKWKYFLCLFFSLRDAFGLTYRSTLLMALRMSCAAIPLVFRMLESFKAFAVGQLASFLFVGLVPFITTFLRRVPPLSL